MEKTTIPELPKSLEGLEDLLCRDFEIVVQVPRVLRCPFCSTEFDATLKACPNCDFPDNALDAYIEESQKTKRTSPERK